MTKIAGSESESISQRHGSVDPDPLQNVMDPQHCCIVFVLKMVGFENYCFGVNIGKKVNEPGYRKSRR
jgi:hypothetical protein